MSVSIFQSVFAHLMDFLTLERNRYTDVDRSRNHTVFCLDDTIAQCQFAVFISKLKTKAGTIAGCTNMFIVEFYKIIFEAGFCKTFKCHPCCIDTKHRCAGMCRNTFCINADLTIFFCYFVFLKFCLSKRCLKPFFQSCFCRNYGITGVTHSIGNKTAIHGNNFCIFGICHHSHLTLFTMDTWEVCIRCKTTG